MATTQEIETKVKQLIIDTIGVEESQITEDASFTDDLGADSLDAVELVMNLESEFKIEIPDEDAEKLTTVCAVIDYLREKGFDKE